MVESLLRRFALGLKLEGFEGRGGSLRAPSGGEGLNTAVSVEAVLVVEADDLKGSVGERCNIESSVTSHNFCLASRNNL